jgi:hypothetical protein
MDQGMFQQKAPQLSPFIVAATETAMNFLSMTLTFVSQGLLAVPFVLHSQPTAATMNAVAS